ncbi:DUF2510 domain-containing protein [uncultured Amnibacterium sp.]|uniref:DUF2510 domain-containing protein n=1 Tax=uncultured Amnibacterium sp. TaxID=1631851 RepID=UPI0035CB5BDD
MPSAGDQPGWMPDPEQPGMLRWWNGLGWSDARKAPDEATQRAVTAAREAVQSSTVTPQQVARITAAKKVTEVVPGAVGTAARTAGAVNGAASGAVALGIAGLIFGLWGVVSLVGLIVSLRGLARSRRLARDGAKRTGFVGSLVGLILNVIGVIRWFPLLAELPDALQSFLNS